MSKHRDALEELNKYAPLGDKIISAHKSIRKALPFIARISIAIYDPGTNMLKTYLHSSDNENPLPNYQTSLDNAPSLKQLLEKGLPRVINNLLTFENGSREHTKRIGRSGYAASYTLPMFNNGEFFGFIFFNSYEKDVFTENVLQQIDIYGHIISLTVINELSSINTLAAAIKTTGRITHARDPETGSHLDRMSRYSRLIASALADKYTLDDSFIEHIFMFSPLHDIGKIAIPDNILLKPGKLDDNEMAIMQTHAHKGHEMIDDILENFGLKNIQYIDMLRNIVKSHHETINGNGYPSGIKNGEIPLEARIVAVADIFDALTSSRTYKEAWTNDEAIETLKQMAGKTLDEDCVNALIDNIEKIITIQKQFSDNTA
ncbi:MAG: HD domain-containing protein [Gammaproteobacteria bacterium]|nr:HD domain-containing protein [Gammaproteobacteria bacterium]MCW8910783.1 HD domain-containing protein [Gammaproteobacteria bacterium]MCW9004209.1 HD domain-containing protein [Gammaproteobacteria bacterium]